MNSGHRARALDRFDLAAGIEPNTDSLNYAAKVAHEMSYPHVALSRLKLSLDLDREQPDMWYSAARIVSAAPFDDVNTAIGYVQQAIGLDLGFAKAFYLLGTLQRRQELLGQSRTSFVQAKKTAYRAGDSDLEKMASTAIAQLPGANSLATIKHYVTTGNV